MGHARYRKPAARVKKALANMQSHLPDVPTEPEISGTAVNYDVDDEEQHINFDCDSSDDSVNDPSENDHERDVNDLMNLELDDSAFIQEILAAPNHQPYNSMNNTSSSVEEVAPLKGSLEVSTRIMTEIYQLGMSRGASIDFMNEVVRLFRDFAKKGHDLSKLPLRVTYLKNSRRHLGSNAPPFPISVKVPDSGLSMPKFSLLGQILDLIASTEFRNGENLVVNSVVNCDPATRFHKFIPRSKEDLMEVNSGKWYSRTYTELKVDPKYDWLFPLIFYIDKTGTDVMQRFPLEPLMFSTTVLKRSIREKASAWRHLGFVPPSEDVGKNAEERLEQYHQCLDVLLSELRELQRSPPSVEVIIDGVTVVRRLILPVAFVMGDQQSQDKLCGRKAVNAGGAGRIHRRCMCSSLSATCTSTACTPIKKDHIEKVIKVSLDINHFEEIKREVLKETASEKEKSNLKSYLKRRSKFAREVLERVYSMYPIKNAWSSISFGANHNGIYRATLDDPMHYCDSGSFAYLADVVFGSMTPTERVDMEKIIKRHFLGKRSSIRELLPRGKFTSGFSSNTLLTAGEKVGLIFSLFVCLGVEEGRVLFDKVLGRIQPKYLQIPTRATFLTKRGDIHFFSDRKPNSVNGEMERTKSGVSKLVKEIVRHNLSFLLDSYHKFDDLQTEYFLHAAHKYLNVPASLSEVPQDDILGVYVRRHKNFRLSDAEKEHADGLFASLRKEEPSNNSEAWLNEECCGSDEDDDTCEEQNRRKKRKIQYEAPTNIPKHNIVRSKVKGDGSTSAILTDVTGFRELLQRALGFHSLVHYFEEVVEEKDDTIDKDVIGRYVADYVEGYCRVIYRGDDSVDCNTCKIHAHLYLAVDIDEYGHPMNWEAGKGERGLKVWAKLASRTALKQSISVFTHQTAVRVFEGALLSKMKSLLPIENPETIIAPPKTKAPNRDQPHFLLDLRTKKTTIHTATAVQRGLFNEKQSIIPEVVINYLQTMEGRDGTLKIWRDATILIGDEDEKKVEKLVRACSIYDKYGAFFDWVQVQWKEDKDTPESDDEDAGSDDDDDDDDDPDECSDASGSRVKIVDTSGAPAKVLLIYEDRNNELCFIVHACNWRNDKEKQATTMLSTRWSLEYGKVIGTKKKKPGKIVLRKVKVDENISKLLYVIEHGGDKPNSMGVNVPKVTLDQHKYVCDVLNPRCEWSLPFLS